MKKTISSKLTSPAMFTYIPNILAARLLSLLKHGMIVFFCRKILSS